jgi:hypothetical protein
MFGLHEELNAPVALDRARQLGARIALLDLVFHKVKQFPPEEASAASPTSEFPTRWMPAGRASGLAGRSLVVSDKKLWRISYKN